jgi:lysophospholipase L1-like esterase
VRIGSAELRLLASCFAALILVVACGSNQGGAGVSTPQSTATPSVQRLRLVVFGDSIAAGTDYGGRGSSGWPLIVANELGLLPLLDAKGGTGYTQSFLENHAYTARVKDVVAANPDIVIIEGSRNDLDAPATKRAATEVLGALQKQTHAKILVIGPIYCDKTDGRTTPVNEAVKAAAISLGLTYVDTIKAGWFTGSARTFVAGDGIHPTDDGHRYLARLIVPLVKPLLPSGYVIPTATASP